MRVTGTSGALQHSDQVALKVSLLTRKWRCDLLHCHREGSLYGKGVGSAAEHKSPSPFGTWQLHANNHYGVPNARNHCSVDSIRWACVDGELSLLLTFISDLESTGIRRRGYWEPLVRERHFTSMWKRIFRVIICRFTALHSWVGRRGKENV